MMDGFSFADYGQYRPGASQLAATGSTYADAAPLRAAVNHFGAVPLGTGCMLPQVQASRTLEITVLNRGANTLAVYPPQGGQIENQAINTPFLVPAGGGALFLCFSPPMQPGTQWAAVVTGMSSGASLPTSSAGLSPGTLWNNGGFVCVA